MKITSGFFFKTISIFIILHINNSFISGQIPADLKNKIIATEQLYNNRHQFDLERQTKISEIKDELSKLSTTQEYGKQYELYKKLYKEYKLFDSQEAYSITLVLNKLAKKTEEKEKITETQLYQAEILLYSGLFFEAYKIINQINISESPQLKSEYYYLLTRLYGDLSTYNNLTSYTKEYQSKQQIYADSLLKNASPSSTEYQMVSVQKIVNKGNLQQALKNSTNFIKQHQIAEHETAMMYSLMAWIANKLNENENEITYLLKSIEADIKSSTYETTSGRILAQLLLENGEVELAQKFVIRSINDAEFYGAQQRKAEITKIVPIIEQQLKQAQQTKFRFVTGIILIILVSLIIIFYLWLRIKKKHKELKDRNIQIKDQNNLLSHQNKQLEESNKIKEEYLTNYFELSSVYFHEIENIKSKVKSLLVQKKYSAISSYLDQIINANDKEILFAKFDTLFLNLFPTFITDFNTLLGKDYYDTQENKLSAELRVFALFRLGIQSADRVASILGISRNTVYTYRNRIKTKVEIPPEKFDEFIMNIPSF